MPTLEQWGGATWTWFHTMAAKMRPESFPTIGKSLIQIIIQISSNLPCPECTAHAKEFFAKMNHHTIQTKQHLINMLHIFHNTVNRRTHKRVFDHDRLSPTYERLHLIQVYNNFIKNFHTKGNMQMLTESFHRTRLISVLQKWMLANINHFVVQPIHKTSPILAQIKENEKEDNKHEHEPKEVKKIEFEKEKENNKHEQEHEHEHEHEPKKSQM